MEINIFIEKVLRESGDLVMGSFGDIVPSQRKIEKSQIVTEVDVASERLIIEAITKEYPQSGIIAEESGFIEASDGTYWIIDPIDGTSNFANGIPWFGIMVAYFERNKPVASGIYLPVTDELYLAEEKKGSYKNGKRITKPRDITLPESLVSFCFSSEDEESAKRDSAIVRRLGPKVLNLRSTNSAYDYAYAVDGKLASTINFRNKIWDVAPIVLLAREAEYSVSEADGSLHEFVLKEDGYAKNYTLFIANPAVTQEILPLLST